MPQSTLVKVERQMRHGSGVELGPTIAATLPQPLLHHRFRMRGYVRRVRGPEDVRTQRGIRDTFSYRQTRRAQLHRRGDLPLNL